MKLRLGMTIVDNDLRTVTKSKGVRKGIIAVIGPEKVTVEWNTGRVTRISIDQIGKTGTKGYRIL